MPTQVVDKDNNVTESVDLSDSEDEEIKKDRDLLQEQLKWGKVKKLSIAHEVLK